jgi:hypothetical protein
VLNRLIGDLIAERDRADKRADEYQKLASEIRDRWHDTTYVPSRNNEFSYGPPRLTQEQVAAWIERRRKEIDS